MHTELLIQVARDVDADQEKNGMYSSRTALRLNQLWLDVNQNSDFR